MTTLMPHKLIMIELLHVLVNGSDMLLITNLMILLMLPLLKTNSVEDLLNVTLLKFVLLNLLLLP